MKRRGFTIIELLVVVAVIGVLAGIITTAAAGAIKNSRAKRAEAMRVALEQGIAAYYVQVGEWPQKIEQKIKSDNMDEDTYTFGASDCDSIFRDVVGAGFGKGSSGKRVMLVDATGLFVAKASNAESSLKGANTDMSSEEAETYRNSKAHGVDFIEAVNKQSRYHILFNQMAFGYQETEHGYFRRFWVVYNNKTDTVKVTK